VRRALACARVCCVSCVQEVSRWMHVSRTRARARARARAHTASTPP
jgi:hypothetical protein